MRRVREKLVSTIKIPKDLNSVLDAAWKAAQEVPGFLVEEEARFLGMVAACSPASGAIVEIGSFKGKSTVMMAKVVEHYGLGKVIAIDPHNFNSPELQELRAAPESSTYDDFVRNIQRAEVYKSVELHRAYSKEVSPAWNRPIRFLWIDGDHTYNGAKTDFDGFFPHLVPGGMVAFHDALHAFSGPIRVFVEDVLRSNQFGAAGFVNSIAWSQFRPNDGELFKKQRSTLAEVAERLIPLVKDDQELTGLRKIFYKLNRSRVPHAAIKPAEWAALLNRARPD